MLLHYLGKLRMQIFCRYSARTEENAIASTFVIHAHVSIFLVFNMSFSPYWLQIKFSMSLFLVVYFCDQFVAPKIRHSRRHSSVCQQSTWYSMMRTRFWYCWKSCTACPSRLKSHDTDRHIENHANGTFNLQSTFKYRYIMSGIMSGPPRTQFVRALFNTLQCTRNYNSLYLMHNDNISFVPIST